MRFYYRLSSQDIIRIGIFSFGKGDVIAISSQQELNEHAVVAFQKVAFKMVAILAKKFFQLNKFPTVSFAYDHTRGNAWVFLRTPK